MNNRGIDSKFTVQKASEKGKQIVYLSGNIDEDARFDELKKVRGPVIFDFGGVTAINSCGVRNWVNLLKGFKQADIAYRRCPPTIVKQLNMVPSFMGRAKVESVFVPYVCHNCDHEQRLLVEVRATRAGLPPRLRCENCGKEEMEIDGEEQQYLAFAA